MTFPCKEDFIEFEQLAGRQQRIFPDACDYGVPFAQIADLVALRGSLKNLIEFFGKPEYDYKAQKWHGGKSVEFFIPIEVDEGREAGVWMRVMAATGTPSCNRVPGGGFISVDIERRTRPMTRT